MKAGALLSRLHSERNLNRLIEEVGHLRSQRAVAVKPRRAGTQPRSSCGSRLAPLACSKSVEVNPRVVRAGVPMRTPPGVAAELSPCTAFLFSEMCTYDDACGRAVATPSLACVRVCVRVLGWEGGAPPHKASPS